MPTFYTHYLRLLDGDSYGTVPPHSVIDNLPERTIAILVRWNGTVPAGQTLISKGDGTQQWFNVISTGEGYEFIDTTGGSQRWRGFALNNATPTVWRWVFLSMRRTDTQSRRYSAIKGGTVAQDVIVDEFGGSGNAESDAEGPLRIGRSLSGNAFLCDIAFLGVWDRRLTAAECQEVVTDLNAASRQPVAAWKPRASSIGSVANFIAGGVAMSLGNQAIGRPNPQLNSGPDIAPPSIISFTPSLGLPGDFVTLDVEDVGTITSASINGLSATFSQPDALTVVMQVPTGASSGPITLVSALGAVSSATPFNVPVPTITAFGPAEGIAGTPVVLSIEYTDAIGAVSFNGTGAVFTRTSPGSVLAYVPAGASTGQIVIEADNGVAVSATPFTVLVPDVDVRGIRGATFIDAINNIMRSVGESPIETLDDLPADGRAAVEILRTGLRELALRPWEFNYDRNVGFNADGYLIDSAGVERSVFVVPDDVAHAVPTVRNEQAGANTPDTSIRRARLFTLNGIKPRVFGNRKQGVDGFEGIDVLYMDVTRFIPFEDLPEVAKHYLTVRAARRYASEVLGSGELTSFKQGDEQGAWIELESQFGIQERYNMFEAYENAPLSRNRNLNTGWTS